MALTILGEKNAWGERVHGHGNLRIELDMGRMIRRKKSIDKSLIGNLHRLRHVREVETIVTDIDRKQYLRILPNPVGHDHGVQNLLVILDKNLDPTSISNSNGILLSTPDALRADAIPSGNHHANGKPE